jgi:uncharacterized protein YfiM (DUF2279 family)
MTRNPLLISLMLLLSACSGSNKSTGGTVAKAPEEFGLSLAALAERIETTETLIATCMATAGLEYVAMDFVSVKQAMDSDQSAKGLSSEDFVKQFGLGITTQFDKPIIAFRGGPQNNSYLDALTESDRVAFIRELWGESPEWNHARALEEEDFSETGGCTRSSAEQTYRASELNGTYVNPADKLVDQDPRMVAANSKWSECMRAEGFGYDNANAVDDDLVTRLQSIAQGQDPKTLSGTALDALKELQGEELAIAALVTSCSEKHVEPVQTKIEDELFGGPPT